MLAVSVWHTVFTHFPKPSKKSNIVFLFPKFFKRASTKVEKVIDRNLKNVSKIIHVAHVRITSKSNHHLKDCLFTTEVGHVCQKRLSLFPIYKNVATLNEAGISTPTGSVLCTVHYTPVCPPLAGLTLNSKKDLDCSHRQE